MSWSRSDLASVVSVLESGSRPKGGASTESGEIPSLGGENILRSGGVTLDGVKRVPRRFYERMTKGHLLDADVLINKDGAQTGKVGLYAEHNSTPSCINEHLFLLRGNTKKITQEYLYYTLLSQPSQNQIDARISGSAQPGLRSDFLRGVFAEIPEVLSEQTKITEILSTVDQAIDQTDELISKHQRLKTGLMQDLLTRGIDEDGNFRSEDTHEFKDSPLGRIPVEWEVQRLEQSVEFWDGKRIPLKQADRDQMPGDYPYYGASGIIDYIDQYLFDDDLILVGEDGENVVSRNLPLAFRVRGKIWVNNHAHVLKPKEGYNTSFLTERLEFYDYTLLISGSAQPKLNQRNLRLLELPMPPEPEQASIGAILSAQEECQRCHTNRLSKLQRIKAALMQDLLSGKVLVTPLLTEAGVRE